MNITRLGIWCVSMTLVVLAISTCVTLGGYYSYEFQRMLGPVGNWLVDWFRHCNEAGAKIQSMFPNIHVVSSTGHGGLTGPAVFGVLISELLVVSVATGSLLGIIFNAFMFRLKQIFNR